MPHTLTQIRQNILITVLLLSMVFAKAQPNKVYSSLELDSLLQSKFWFCSAPVAFSNFFDSLNNDRVLLPNCIDYSCGFMVKFDQQNFSLENGMPIKCGTESHSIVLGLYYLNGDGTVTIQPKWSECRGQLCFDNPQREAINVPARTYRILVQDDKLILKLKE